MNRFALRSLTVLSAAIACQAAHSQQAAPTLSGRVLDPLGAAVAGAKVELVAVPRGTRPASTAPEGTKQSVSTADGAYALSIPAPGRYSVRITSPGFPVTMTPPRFLAGSEKTTLTLGTPTLSDEITVTATGTPQPLAQSAEPITVLNQPLDYLHFTEVQEPLRLIPGLQITQTGQAGGLTTLSIRGGQGSFNKVLIDGVPTNDIGGNVDFANLATVGIARVEVLRQPNSVLYGSDDLSGVVLLTTARGTTPLPQFTYAADGGNLGQFRQEGTAAGAHKRLDYYAAIARFQTNNNEPNDEFHNVTSVANLGYALNSKTDLRFTVRHLTTNGGSPYAIALFGLPNFANSKEHDTYLTGTASQQTTSRWHNELQYGHQALNSRYQEYAPSGIPVPDGMGGIAEYLGLNETITGANGYSVTGQAYFNGNPPYTPYLTTARRDFVYAQTDYRLTPHTVALGTFNYNRRARHRDLRQADQRRQLQLYAAAFG